MNISRRAFDLIVAEEVTSKAAYEKKYSHPEWPGEQSGVTIGIGYDVGYATPARLHSDWSGLIPDGMISTLEAACGVRGPKAASLAKIMRTSVDVPWDAAIAVFQKMDIPRWEATVRKALPHTDLLSPDSFGALVSLAYNRGASFSQTADRYKEMRAIKAHMASEDFDKIPAEFRAMKRLWPTGGLAGRREREAKLFKDGLATATTTTSRPPPADPNKPQPDPNDEAPPIPPGDDGPKPAEPPIIMAPPVPEKPATKSGIIRTAIMGIVGSIGAAFTQIGAIFSDWRALAILLSFLILTAFFGYIVWKRQGMPDIQGWFK